ncbi:MAG TPA: amidohydrolase family protein [Pseudonocardia sp.]
MTVALQTVGPVDGAAHLAGRAVAALRGVRLPDGTLGDVLLDGAVVADAQGAGVDLDAAGWRVLAAAVEPHAHLDKALSAVRLPPGSGNDLVAACDSWRALAPALDRADIEARALAAVRRYVAHGITAIRTHVDLHPGPDPFRGVDALIGLRERLRGRVTLQVCLLAGAEAPTELVEAAAVRGIDVMGGCPHLALDPQAELTRMLDVAQAHALPVDLHVDETTAVDLPDGDLDIVGLAHQTIQRGLRQPVAASHAVRLGMLPPSRLDPVLTLVAQAGLGIVTLPITNLYLQGRDATHAAPRGLPALHAILAAGIPLAAGADNVRDPFNPAGRADPFETTMLLQTAGHLTADEALHAVTTGARRVLGLPKAGVAPGEAADLVLVPDVDLGDVLAGTEDARVVLHGGRVVADTRVQRSVDL